MDSARVLMQAPSAIRLAHSNSLAFGLTDGWWVLRSYADRAVCRLTSFRMTVNRPQSSKEVLRLENL